MYIAAPNPISQQSSLAVEAPVRAQSTGAAENRRIATAVQALNENGVAGPAQEFSFSIDPRTKQAVIQIVDSATREPIYQIPSEYILREAEQLAEFLK